MQFLSKVSAVALFVTSALAAQAEPIVSQIDVQADFEAVQSTATSSFWPTVEADLKAELSQRLAAYAGENGVNIKVSIRELAVNPAVSNATYEDLNGIDGTVAIQGPEENSPLKSFRVAYTVLPPVDSTPIPGVIVLPPGAADNYAALIDAVADDVEAKLAEYPM